MTKREKAIMDELLKSYDWNIWCIDKSRDDYMCGAADASGQAIINVGKLLGENSLKAPKTEAYARVMSFESVEQYKRKYGKPLADYQKV